MMNINFYVKSMKSFIILSVMWYERLTKCYLLHTDPSEFRELGKTCQATYFPLSTLNIGSLLNILFGPPNHDSQNSLDETHELGSWAKKWNDVLWAWTIGFDVFLCKYGLFWALKEVFPKFMIMLTWCGLPMKWNYVVWKICPKHISNKRVTRPKKASSTYSTKPNQKTISLYKKRECPFGLFN